MTPRELLGYYLPSVLTQIIMEYGFPEWIWYKRWRRDKIINRSPEELPVYLGSFVEQGISKIVEEMLSLPNLSIPEIWYLQWLHSAVTSKNNEMFSSLFSRYQEHSQNLLLAPPIKEDLIDTILHQGTPPMISLLSSNLSFQPIVLTQALREKNIPLLETLFSLHIEILPTDMERAIRTFSLPLIQNLWHYITISSQLRLSALYRKGLTIAIHHDQAEIVSFFWGQKSHSKEEISEYLSIASSKSSKETLRFLGKKRKRSQP